MSGPPPRTVRVRRGPRVGVFLVAGAVVGVVVAGVLTLVSPVTGSYSAGQVFGFLALFCVAAGVLGGGLVAVLLDARSRRRARTGTVERERIRVQDE